MANRNWLSNKMYQMEAYPVLVSCAFTVAASSETGVSGLTGGAVKSVYMTATVPGGGNPNPSIGFIQVQLQDNYSKLLGMSCSLAEPVAGVQSNNVVAGEPVSIVSLGTTTAAEWLVAGLPAGVTAAVGQAFVPLVTAPIGGTGEVDASAYVLAPDIAIVGDPNALLQNSNNQVNGGAILVLVTRESAALTGLQDGTKVRLSFYLSNSSVVVNGQ